MQFEYKYIYFELYERKPKTLVYSCCNNNSHNILGFIKWYAPWRQYCFFTSEVTIFNKGCMEDIIDFINQLMEQRKNLNKEKFNGKQ